MNVAFNPKITCDFGKDSSLHRERSMLINLAIDFLQDFHKCSIHRDYTILKKPKVYKGSIARAVSTLTKRARENDAVVEQQVDELENMFGTLPDSDKSSMMNTLGHIVDSSKDSERFDVDDDLSKAQNDDDSTSTNDVEQKLKIVHEPAAPQKKPFDIKLPGSTNSCKKASSSKLIEEVGSETGCTLVEPKHSTSTVTKNEKLHLVVKVELPGVTSVDECELDISKVSILHQHNIT